MKKSVLIFVLCFVFQLFGFSFAQNSSERASLQISWGPYMSKVQKRIYSNWVPNKEEVSNRIIVSFKIMKDGNIKDLKILKSSENPNQDKAALLAVEKAAPFEALPSAFNGENVPIEFTFDHIVHSSAAAKVQKNTLAQAVELLKNCPFDFPYGLLTGNNISLKPVILKFKNLSEEADAYANFDLLTRFENDATFYMYINRKHFSAPKEALAALVAARVVDLDFKNSINEEAYSLLIEAYTWKYLTKNKPEIKTDNNFLYDPLVRRELAVAKIVDRSKTADELVKYVESVASYKSYKKTSPGFSDKQFNQKFSELKQMYDNL